MNLSNAFPRQYGHSWVKGVVNYPNDGIKFQTQTMQISGYIGELWAHFLDVWSLDGESDSKTMTVNEVCIDFQNSYFISMHKFYYINYLIFYFY